jgi:hypothetical protein
LYVAKHLPEPENTLMIQMLDLSLFVNGGFNKLLIWESNILKEIPNAYTLHNNWIVGNRNKVARQIKKHMWYYDRDTMICLYEPEPIVDPAFADHPIYTPPNGTANFVL